MNNRHQYSNPWQLFVQSIQTRSLHPAQRSLSRRFFLLMGASTLITSACTRAGLLDNQSGNSASETVKGVKHAFGETEVPANPTQIIVWGYAIIDAVIAHEAQPIGVPNGAVDRMSYFSLDKEAVAEIGDPGQPNLEKIAALQPDLILTRKNRVRDAAYPLLAQIAPTIVFDIENNAEWRELTRLCGEALGKPLTTAKLSAAYETKLQEVRTQFSQKGEPPQVSVVYVSPESIGAMGTETFAGSVLAYAGLSRPPSQAQAQGPRNLSLESLDLLDGDVIFLMKPQTDTDAAVEIRTEIDRIQAHPLWSQLKAVQMNQVYEVGPHWAVGSYIAANLILDDLLKYLAN
ncbi:MAG: ABC transporter substrate-binding protein [Leptolyngbya sp. SIO1E4]|nr:ABC transporter substrate-binding protein [Leptolyngbya sp. SIO1E4]